MNIRDILADPFLPVMSQLKADKKSFFIEWVLLTLCVCITAFLLVFLVRLAWILPPVLVQMKYTKQDKILINAFVQAQKDIEHFYLQALREKNLQKAKYYAEKAKLVVQELQEEYQDWALTR